MSKKNIFYCVIKKSLSIITIICLCISTNWTGIFVSEAKANSEVLQCGPNAYAELDYQTGVIRVYGQGKMYDYTCCPYGTRSDVKKVQIEKGITRIGNWFFNGLRSIETITLPETLSEIGCNSFSDCEFEYLTIPNLVSIIEEDAFTRPDDYKKIKEIHYCNYISGLTILHPEGKPQDFESILTTHDTTMSIDVIKEATCTEWGIQKKACSKCDWYETSSIGKLGHNYSEVISKQPSCSQEGEKIKECSRCGETVKETIDKLPHSYLDTVIEPTKSQQGYTLHTCSVCGDNYKDNYVNYEDVYSEGTCGTNTTYVLNKETGLFKIEGSGNMTNYDDSNPPWFADKSLIKKVEISQGVTSVGNQAFAHCNNLETVVLPNSIKTIGDFAFAYCQKLSSINLPNNLQTIGNYAFEDCIKLNNITIPNKLTSIGNGSFYNCSSLTKIVVPNSVSSLGTYAFASCGNLQSAELKNNPSAIVDGLFEDCESLKNFTIPNSVKKIEDNAFSGCSSLTSLNIPSGVTGIGNGAYSYCSGIKTVVIPLSTIWIGDDAFAGCDSLVTTYYLGNKDEWSFVYMGKNNGKLISGLNFHVCAYTKTKVVKPTYTSKGYTIHICEVCGKQYIDSYVDALKKIAKVPSAKIKKIKAKKKSLKLTWKKIKGITGYKIQYSLKKNFKKAKTITIKKANVTSKAIKKLKKKKKYYIRIRTYIIANGKTYLSDWSKVRAKKTK